MGVLVAAVVVLAVALKLTGKKAPDSGIEVEASELPETGYYRTPARCAEPRRARRLQMIGRRNDTSNA